MQINVCKKRAFGIPLPLPTMFNKNYQQAVRIMKITAFILLVCLLQVSAKSPAQERITIREKGASLVKIFTQINKQTGYNFFFTNEDLRNAKPVDIEVKNASLKEVLDLLFKKQNLTYIISDKIITIVSKKNDEPLKDAPVVAPPIDIHGKVVDENGKPVPSVTITVKGTKKQTITDEKGEFSISDVSDNGVLLFSSVNMEAFEINVSGQKEIFAKLKTKTSELDEVQIIAYGQTTKRFQTGNIQSVKGSEIESQPVSNPLLALQGKVAGLNIVQSKGVPGSGVTVRLQGSNSIGRGNDPLYVIDGIPYTSQLLPGNLSDILGESGGRVINGVPPAKGNPLSFIDPGSIESIEVLKDADATAIYGSLAANGAILITTKQGRAGKTKIDANIQTGWGKVTRTLNLLNTEQYLIMRKEAKQNDNASVYSNDYDINGVWDTLRNTNWQKELIGGTAQYRDFRLSLSGGNSTTKFIIGTAYHKETTVFPGDFADKKASFHFNLNHNSLDQKFKTQLSGNYMVNDNRLLQSDLTNAAITLAPDAPRLYNDDGTLNWMPNTSGASTWTNPLSKTLNTYRNKTNNLIGHLNLSYEILRGLSVTGSFGYNSLQTNENTTNPLIAIRPEQRPFESRGAGYMNSSITTWIVEPQLNYEAKIGAGHLKVLFGSTILQTNSEVKQLFGSGYNSDLVLTDIKAASTVGVGLTLNSTYKYNAAFGRITYNFHDKYLFNLNGRRDGSSRFGVNNQFHNFSSAGVGWIFSQESFIHKGLRFISFGKLRGSYGTTGNDQIGDYQFLNLYRPLSSGVAYQGIPALQPAGLPNYHLQWEETKKLQLGIDLAFFHDMLQITSNYVLNRSSNQLLYYALPSMDGFNSILQNFPASVENKSLEFVASVSNVKLKNFVWNSSINLTVPKNKLVSFSGLETSTYANQLVVGQPINVLKVFKFNGVNPSTGVYQFIDKDGNLTSDPDYSKDRIVLINTLPKFYGGIQNSFALKGFELSVLFQFVKQLGNNYLFGNVYPIGYNGMNRPVTVTQRWKKPGDVTSIQRYSSNFDLFDQQDDVLSSDASWTDASYIRLKNLSLSWTLTDSWKKNLHLDNCVIYVQGENLLTITRFKGLDPETQNTTALPPLKMLTVGIRTSF